MYCDFTDNVSMQTYGDDNVLNISDRVIEWYNQKTITDALASMGLTYTDEAKTGELVEYRTLEEISYLKRKFVLNDRGFYQAPLDIQVCKEMPNWIRGTAKKEATKENALAALVEISLHGQEVYDSCCKQLWQSMFANECPTRLPTYAEMIDHMERFYGGKLT
jgi:hypothetical protein